MPEFTRLTSRMAYMPQENIDTDQIIPARYLKLTDREGFGKHLFADWRYLPDGSPNPTFLLNQLQPGQTNVLLAGDNFGCGSSREHAPWALYDWGFRAVISTSFADIFKNNALKNGLLPIPVEAGDYQKLVALITAEPHAEISIDLTEQTITLPDGSKIDFPIDHFSKHCLLEGIDSLDYLLSMSEPIERYEAKHDETYAG
ncbi:MAG: 3-isopropylmalate dehydratase small subunit [Anaerolineales bacterium]|jgi:3-isopropylmalate/(R)-2-methylmalate dehydratase small subunit